VESLWHIQEAYPEVQLFPLQETVGRSWIIHLVQLLRSENTFVLDTTIIPDVYFIEHMLHYKAQSSSKKSVFGLVGGSAVQEEKGTFKIQTTAMRNTEEGVMTADFLTGVSLLSGCSPLQLESSALAQLPTEITNVVEILSLYLLERHYPMTIVPVRPNVVMLPRNYLNEKNVGLFDGRVWRVVSKVDNGAKDSIKSLMGQNVVIFVPNARHLQHLYPLINAFECSDHDFLVLVGEGITSAMQGLSRNKSRINCSLENSFQILEVETGDGLFKSLDRLASQLQQRQVWIQLQDNDYTHIAAWSRVKNTVIELPADSIEGVLWLPTLSIRSIKGDYSLSVLLIFTDRNLLHRLARASYCHCHFRE
jgi:hypothetical protein